MNGKISFAFATPEDDDGLRALLRASPMNGAIRVSFAHEPNYFASANIGLASDRTLIARHGHEIIAMGRCTTRELWLNGEIRRCAYLGELRLHPRFQGRSEILRRGYAFFADHYRQAPADFCFSSIVADNDRATRVLTRGIRGLPHYRVISPFTTLLIPVRDPGKGRPYPELKIISGAAVPIDQLVDLLNHFGRARNLAPHWTVAKLTALAGHNLRRDDFVLLQRDSSIVGCAAIWDQRPFRQVRIEGYSRWLSTIRPFANFAARFTGAALPPPGTVLAQAFLSPFYVEDADPRGFSLLIHECLQRAADKGLHYLNLGFAPNDPLAKLTQMLPARRYQSQLYSVTWPGVAELAPALDFRPCRPELALL